MSLRDITAELMTVLMRCTDAEYGAAALFQFKQHARAEVLREIADDLESRLVEDPGDEAEEHVNDCYRADVRRLRRKADEAAKGGV